MKRVITLGVMVVAVAMVFGATAGTVTVTGVTARQRYPWEGKVDITVTITGDTDDVAKASCSFNAINSVTKEVLPVAHITRVGDDVESDNVCTRKFVWDAGTDIGSVKIGDVAFTVGIDVNKLGGVQLWENGPYWAECNVGATKPEEYGYYFWWGDTVGYEHNASNSGWVSVKDGTGFSFRSKNCPTYGKGKLQLLSEEYIDATGNLVAAHDAAAAHLGAPWRMPTSAEMSDLIANCDLVFVNDWNGSGINGLIVKGMNAYASKSIFLPLTGLGVDDYIQLRTVRGEYWTSSPFVALRFNDSHFDNFDNNTYQGYPVRPLREFIESSVATTHLALDYQVGSFCAAVVNITEGSTTGYTMTNRTVYVIQNSMSFSNISAGGSGMSVEDGATVVLYVPRGVTLTAIGANGSGKTGGGAGIRVPETSFLVITGEGMVNVAGGNAGDGVNGEKIVYDSFCKLLS